MMSESTQAIDRAGQLYAVYLEAGGSCLKGDEPFPDHFPGQCNICGLLGVEAAVRADQIEKDAGIARDTATGANNVKPQTYRGDAYAKDKRSAQIETSIRAQLEGTTDE